MGWTIGLYDSGAQDPGNAGAGSIHRKSGVTSRRPTTQNGSCRGLQCILSAQEMRLVSHPISYPCIQVLSELTLGMRNSALIKVLP